MNGWSILLVLLVILAVAYSSALAIDAAALRSRLDEATAEIEDLNNQVGSLKTQLEGAVAEKIAVEKEAQAAGCIPTPVTGETGSAQSPAADEAASGRVSRLLVILPAMAVNLAWLAGIVVYRVYANATRGTRRMRLTLAEAEAIRARREGRP